jgi:hypothetical protein
MTEQMIATPISYHQMIAGGALHSPVVRREAAEYSQHLIERSDEYTCIPRMLAARIVEFLEQTADERWLHDPESVSAEIVAVEAQRLVRAWHGKPVVNEVVRGMRWHRPERFSDDRQARTEHDDQ